MRPAASPETEKIMSQTTKPINEADERMLGCDILVKALEREGVEHVFAYPGGASLEIHQALTRSNIRVILPRHEQGGAFAAGGYARATGKPGVCMATSGPGATNLVTGIADAYMDSVPMVAITGQVVQAMIGKSAFQEIDIYGMTLPIVKHSYLITDINDIPRIVKEAVHLAQSGRPGPVLIDFPKNIQQAKAKPAWVSGITLRGYDPVRHAEDAQLAKVIELIANAQRPALYCGGGIITGEASAELREFVERTKIPVTTTLMGCGAFPEEHPLSLRWLGMHGAAFANWAVNGEYKHRKSFDEPMVKLKDGADLLLAFGVRFDDRVTGKLDEFCKGGTIVHIDIDQSEHNKNKKVQFAIESDIKFALGRMNEMLAKKPLKTDLSAWHAQVAEWKARAPFHYTRPSEILHSDHIKDPLKGREADVILPQMAIEALYELTKGDALICTGVGQHQMWAAQFYKFKEPRQFLTSAGLGAMGFGYPAAMGAKVACPNRQVVDIDGDGAFMMNIQELACAHIERIAAKVMILNNQHLGMVMQWEDRFYKGNRGNTFLGDPKHRRELYPDYVAIANGFGVPAERVVFKQDLHAAIQRMLDSDQPYLLDIVCPHTEHVMPFIPAGRTVADMVV